MVKNVITILAATVAIMGLVALATHQWSDCLEENSFFTCARMLNK
jgi:hypothetical protein